jgi:hypothetical protein
MKKQIVITSIFQPTEAVIAFSKLDDYKLLVVGDKKTPANWACDGVDYISVEDQQGYELSSVLPYNHYCRKMIGYIKAMQNGAEFIVDTDDDNIPKENWIFPEFESTFDKVDSDLGFVNMYELYTDRKIWPRGLPLQLINTRFDLENKINKKDCKVGIWQGLADEDPDVDAIYRLTDDTPCYFSERPPVVISSGTICPFNTQNTMIRKELFALMYLPTYVTFRFTDILRGLVAQPIMWLYGYELGFLNATVVQKRNPHDYMKDFISEIPMYQYCEKSVELVQSAISASNSIEDNLHKAYEALLHSNIVTAPEMVTLEAWLKDLQGIGK